MHTSSLSIHSFRSLRAVTLRSFPFTPPPFSFIAAGASEPLLSDLTEDLMSEAGGYNLEVKRYRIGSYKLNMRSEE